jgi:hypothetical protein
MAFTFLCALVSARGSAQPVPSRVTDARLRIETRHVSMVTGRVVRVSRDSVVLHDDQTRALVGIPQTDILVFEESLGSTRGRSARRGALYGAGLGLAVIAGGGLAASHGHSDWDWLGPWNARLTLPLAALLPLIGAGIGAAQGGEHWTPPTAVHVAAAVRSSHALSVGVSWGFE